MVTFKGANLITVTFQTKPHWPPGHRELAFLRTFNFHATTGAGAAYICQHLATAVVRDTYGTRKGHVKGHVWDIRGAYGTYEVGLVNDT